MSSSSTTMPCPAAQDQETLVLGYLEHVNGLLCKYATTSGLEFEDLRQDAAVTILHCLEKRPDVATQLHGYIVNSVRNKMIDRIRYQAARPTTSLHTALRREDGGQAALLVDLIADDDMADPLALLLIQERLQDFRTWLESHKTARGTVRRQHWYAYERFLKEGQQQ